MLTVPPSVRVFVAVGATDMRLGMDGLDALARSRLGLDPLSGHLILFRNRRGDRLKILLWDRSGYWVLYKRLEKGTFSWPQSPSMLASRCARGIFSSCSRAKTSRAPGARNGTTV